MCVCVDYRITDLIHERTTIKKQLRIVWALLLFYHSLQRIPFVRHPHTLTHTCKNTHQQEKHISLLCDPIKCCTYRERWRHSEPTCDKFYCLYNVNIVPPTLCAWIWEMRICSAPLYYCTIRIDMQRNQRAARLNHTSSKSHHDVRVWTSNHHDHHHHHHCNMDVERAREGRGNTRESDKNQMEYTKS